MSLARSLIGVVFSVFVLVGSAGMNVFTHSCEEDGVMKSYIVKLDDHCSEHMQSLPPCCEEKKVAKDACCNDEMATYQVKFDFYDSYNVSIPFLPALEQKPFFVLYPKELKGATSKQRTIHPPPKLIGRDILIRNQVFRI
jgi:hypothetical protein